MLWVIFSGMLLTALLIVLWPIYRHRQRVSFLLTASVLSIMLLSAALYTVIGNPDAKSAAGTDALASIDDVVSGLEARLVDTPDDVQGWLMLGRTYLQLGSYSKAVAALEKAMELEGGTNGETLISLGEALLTEDRDSISGRAGQLIESGLSLSPNSQRGLFYGGFSALERQDKALAADRWEALLALSPPEDIRPVLEKRIREWRGESPEDVQESNASIESTAADENAVSIEIRLSDEAAAATAGVGSVFVIARDPAAPAPPVAVVRIGRDQIPGLAQITDANAMISGRVPSAFPKLEYLVRISLGGQPIPQPGDWFGQTIFSRSDGSTVVVSVDQLVR